MSVQSLAALIGKAVQEARNGGIAKLGVYSDGSVIVDGRQLSCKVIVPIVVQDGQKVYVQVSSGDNVAYIIG